MTFKLSVALETNAIKELNFITKTEFTITKLRLAFLRVSNPTTLTTRERESDRMEKKLIIRKLTPLETCKLMGFEKADFQAMRDIGMSDAAIWHCCGDSIVVTCLMAIFGQMLLEEKDLQQKINDYVEKVRTE